MPRKKKEETVQEVVKAEAAEKVETAVKETAEKAEAVVKETAKKAGKAAKKTAEKAEAATKEAVEKIAEKVEVAKPRRAAAKKAVVPTISIQSVMGGEITVDEIVKRVSEAAGKAAKKSCEIYVKAEENKAFYVVDGETGSVDLW